MIAMERVCALLALPSAGYRRTGKFVVLLILVVGVTAGWHWRELLDPTVVSVTISRYPLTPLVFLAVHIAASLA